MADLQSAHSLVGSKVLVCSFLCLDSVRQNVKILVLFRYVKSDAIASFLLETKLRFKSFKSYDLIFQEIFKKNNTDKTQNSDKRKSRISSQVYASKLLRQHLKTALLMKGKWENIRSSTVPLKKTLTSLH